MLGHLHVFFVVCWFIFKTIYHEYHRNVKQFDPDKAGLNFGPGLEVIKLFSNSTQLSMKFIMLIKVKMPTIVGILTFISMINTAAEEFESKKQSIFSILFFMSR